MATHRGQQRDKPFRDALRIEISEASGNPKKLRKIAKALLDQAGKGKVDAIREVADRLDGKVPQAVVGDDDHPPIAFSDADRAAALKAFLDKARK